jgi:hypothetical protein
MIWIPLVCFSLAAAVLIAVIVQVKAMKEIKSAEERCASFGRRVVRPPMSYPPPIQDAPLPIEPLDGVVDYTPKWDGEAEAEAEALHRERAEEIVRAIPCAACNARHAPEVMAGYGQDVSGHPLYLCLKCEKLIRRGK